MPTTYYHLVFTLPPSIAQLAEADLTFHGQLARLNHKAELKSHIAKARQQDWVVYAKAPLCGPEKAIEYPGRYTHKVPITNHQLVSMSESKVNFRYKNYNSADPQQ